MRVKGDYHTHTIYSRNGHGKGTIEENARSAYERGLKEIAICDHGPGHVFFGVLPEKFSEIREEIDRVNRLYEGEDFRVLMGCEANVTSFDGDWDLTQDMRAQLDICAVGFHYGVKMKDIKSAWTFFILNPLSKIIPPLRRRMAKKNTDALIRIIEKHPVTFLSHPGDKAAVDVERLADACAKHGVFMEINSHHAKLSTEDVRMAMRTDVQFIINSDAHHPDHIGHVSEGLKRAQDAGVPLARIRNATE